MNALTTIGNAATRSLATMFPGFFVGAKHNTYRDFGYPETLTFDLLYKMYLRNGIAHAMVNKTILKTWESMPYLLEKERDGSENGTKKETALEREIRVRFDDLRFWARLADADRMALVGGYAGVLLSFRDNGRWQDPVDRVPGGLDGIAKIIPAWAGQLEVSEWDTDPQSETYGEPKMYQFNEANVETGKANNRQMLVHPDRVVIWSRDETVHSDSMLEPGYNDLMTLEKISGAGGEGFWKNAKSAPVLEVDKEAKIADMAKAMGVAQTDIADKMNEQVADWQKGFDQLLMLQGMSAKTLGVTLPSPEHFWAAPLQGAAASVPIPVKILVGNQIGERASTEDANEWAQTNMSRRANEVVPIIMAMVKRFVRFGILPTGKDWYLDWADLTEASMGEKIERADKMADVNQKMKDSGEVVFTSEEIRFAVGYEPLSEADKFRDDPNDDAIDALPPPSDPAEDAA
ncbi:anti-CBASS protein Acb1 family protein [Pelagibacterium lentulum]|uniref:Anti-CBASS protein Acb1-like N-terminal domain-containing protein n=1 Tax=Pelagibacterium lentulum TaxID=2029865 RepID=A0A916RQ27_9HYPH|nr:anti-CBASS Acb1 family protein [Pelagibacterium lentulum]GGA64882.1 hypothetical protein GCM10011499_39160 [Pelagibacterium lentulum]